MVISAQKTRVSTPKFSCNTVAILAFVLIIKADIKISAFNHIKVEYF